MDQLLKVERDSEGEGAVPERASNCGGASKRHDDSMKVSVD